MLLRASSSVTFDNPVAVPMVLMLRPRSGEGQWVKAESYDVTPHTLMTEYTDSYGNLCQRLTAAAGLITITSSCDVEVPDAVDHGPGVEPTPVEFLPAPILQFLLPSRYVESDKLIGAANGIVEGFAPGYDQAERVRTWVQQNVAYTIGSTDSSTSACDVWTQRRGVCRDQAHLGMALCRALSLPSRMVVGYLYNLEPMDLHAWFECYVGGRWWTFDAKEPVTEGGRIAIAYGRDAADVALATQFGPSHLQSMQVTVEQIGF